MGLIVSLSNRMYMTHKRQHSLKVSKEHRLERLISEFNQQLKISSTTQHSFNLQKNSNNDHLPSISPDRIRSHDRFLSERLKYQHNLHTVIGQIKSKLQTTHRSTFKDTRTHTLQPSPVKQLNQSDFKIKSINLSPQIKSKASNAKSYVEACQKRLAQQRMKKRSRYQRFDFQPWAPLEDNQVLQTIDL